MSRSRARCVRFALATALVLVLAPEAARAELRVRVLLQEGRGPIRVDAPNGEPVRVRKSGAGLSANGGPVSDVWRTRGAGPWTVGPLRVRGHVEVRRTAAGLAAINELSLEDYVAGTLAREVYPRWAPAALRAQAVAIRTYVLYRARRDAKGLYHVSADTASQVYGGIDAETPAVRAAVDATRGEILTFLGEPILAAFHSASGGRTAAASEVWGQDVGYLVSRPVEHEDDSPDTYWRAAVSRTTLRRVLEALGHELGRVRDVKVIERSASGRAGVVQVRGEAGRIEIRGRALRNALGESTLKSTLFEVRASDDGFLFVGSGSGHGVGMSQWGARALAERGADHPEILETFYPGARIETLGVRGAVGAR